MERRSIIQAIVTIPIVLMGGFKSSYANEDITLPMARDLLMPGLHGVARQYKDIIKWWDIGISNNEEALVVAIGDRYKNTVFGSIYIEEIRSGKYKSMFRPVLQDMYNSLLVKTENTNRFFEKHIETLSK